MGSRPSRPKRRIMTPYIASLSNNGTFFRLFGKQSQNMTIELLKRWRDPRRFYHSIDNHLIPMLDQIKMLSVDANSKQLLEIATWFHDCIYDPKSRDNELNSIRFFINKLENKYCADANIIRDIIRVTIDFECDTALKVHFANLDLDYLNHTDVKRIVQNELLLLKEFQFVDYSIYKQRRLNIIAELSRSKWTSGSTIRQIVDYLGYHKPKIGIYPGSFNPFHVGHLSILQEAEKMFDKVIVAIGINPEKHSGIDHNILQKVKETLPYHQVESFKTFLHEYAEEKSNDADITIVRGFRSGYDIDYELTNLAFIRDMSKDLKMVFIAPQKKFDHVSSSAIRLIKNFSEKQSKIYVSKVYYPYS